MFSGIMLPVAPQPKQFSLQEGNYVAMTYRLHRGTNNCYKKVVAAFSGMFPAAKVPSKRTVQRIRDKQNEYYTVHNLNSSSSPGFG
jgi:hypothetical protein